MERNRRTTVQGTVTSTKTAKTITVTVSTKRNDPLYAKRVSYSKKYHAHDEKGEAKLGDTVTIMACRPISKTKRYRLVSIDKKATATDSAASVEEKLEAIEGSKEEVASVREEASEAEERAE